LPQDFSRVLRDVGLPAAVLADPLGERPLPFARIGGHGIADHFAGGPFLVACEFLHDRSRLFI
jgi:hypothetical protein